MKYNSMKINRIIISIALLFGLVSCDMHETDYELALIYLGRTQGCNLFDEGDVNIVADRHGNVYNTGADQVEFAFVKDLVYRLRMINKIPEDGWTDTIQHINIQDGYVGRLLKADGSYKYCRFFVYTEDFDANADKYLLVKYHSSFSVN